MNRNIYLIFVCSIVLLGCSTTKLTTTDNLDNATNLNSQNVAAELSKAALFQVALADCLNDNYFVDPDRCSFGAPGVPAPSEDEIAKVGIATQNVVISFKDSRGFLNNGSVILLPVRDRSLIRWKCLVSNNKSGQIDLAWFPSSLACTEVN